MKQMMIAWALAAGLNLVAATESRAEIPDLTPERVRAIKGYLSRQACALPKIDGENYGVRHVVPSAVFYYGYTVDPLTKLKGFESLGHLPDRDADDTGSTFLSAGLEMGTLKGWGVEIVPRLKAAGFKRARLNYGWRLIEKEKGVYDFSQLDAWVDALLAAGIEPWLYGGYGNALYYGKFKPAKLVSSFWDAPVYHGEEAMTAWLNFFRALAEHYKGKVRFYEIWNELDGRWYKFGEGRDARRRQPGGSRLRGVLPQDGRNSASSRSDGEGRHLAGQSRFNVDVRARQDGFPRNAGYLDLSRLSAQCRRGSRTVACAGQGADAQVERGVAGDRHG